MPYSADGYHPQAPVRELEKYRGAEAIITQRRGDRIDKRQAQKAALDQDGVSSPSAGPRGQQQLQLLEEPRLANQDEVDFQESLIIERESEIRNIEQSVGELNELLRDVAHMVHDQGQSLDIISENVEQTRDDTRGADYQLRKASQHQKSARGKACCLLLILVIVLTIVILAAVLG